MNRKTALGIGFVMLAAVAQAQQTPSPDVSRDRLQAALPTAQALQPFEITEKPEVVSTPAFRQVRLLARRRRDNASLSVEIRYATAPFDLRTVAAQDRESATPPEQPGTPNQQRAGDAPSHTDLNALKKGIFNMTAYTGQTRVRVRLTRPVQAARRSAPAPRKATPAFLPPLERDGDAYFVERLLQQTVSRLAAN